MERFAEQVAKNNEISKLLEDAKRPWMQELKNSLTTNENFLTKSERLSDAFLVNYYPRPEDRLADEITENTRVNREILDEMRKQSLERAEDALNLQGEPEFVRAVNLAFDIVDAATERCLSGSAIGSVKIKRNPVTTGSVAYNLYESELRYLGKVTIRKTGDNKSEIEVSSSPIPEDQDVIEYYYHEFGWRIEGGSYRIRKGEAFETVHESELIPLAKELQEKRRKHLSETVIPAYFECLKDIWSIEEQSNLIVPIWQFTKAGKSEPRYKSILEKAGFVDKTGWDIPLIELWNKGYSRSEIAQRVHVSGERVTNRISELRRILGKDGRVVLPYDRDRKKQIMKSRGIT
jgi:hypothetical protein